MKEDFYWLWLSKLGKITSNEKLKLIAKYGIDEIWNIEKKQVFEILNNHEKVKMFFENRNTDILNKDYEYINKNEIKVVTILDEEYPYLLKNIYDFPIALYMKGNVNALKNTSVALVGARNASEYGIKIAKNMGYNLAKKRFNIVSGLAMGIDKYSHIGAINSGGITTAIIGSGLDIIYPKENIKLYYNIIENHGLIATEYPLGTNPKPSNFPARNRIISGISKGVIVIEASKKSGALITADFALEQGRNVYAIPRKYK